MELKYVGPKADISHTGISFDTNKEDKYVYLGVALQLIKAIDHDYIPDKSYVFTADKATLTNAQINLEVRERCNQFDVMADAAIKNAEAYIADLTKSAQENRFIGEIERNAFLKDIAIMHDYIVQRDVNKAIYYCVVEILAEKMKSEYIDHITVPLFQQFAHVLHSAQGVLERQKFPIDTKVEVFRKEGQLFFKMSIINR